MENSAPMSFASFLDFTASLGLGAVEFPFFRFFSDPTSVTELKSMLKARQLAAITDSEKPCDPVQIENLLPIARHLGSQLVRIKTSNVLGCDRQKLGIPWADHLDHVISVVNMLAPTLREYGLQIAIENHQDVDSADLIHIIEEVGEAVVGVNYDIGNAFATCEDTMEFAKRLSSHILNIHLKDYKIYKSHAGFRLVRCSIGTGDVDFRSLFPFFRDTCPQARLIIETGALNAREIKISEEGFWDSFLRRDSLQHSSFLQFLEKHQKEHRKDTWQTPWERQLRPEEIVEYEKREIIESVTFLEENI